MANEPGTSSLGVTRTEFLAKVRASLGRQGSVVEPPAVPAPAVDASIARLVRHDADLVGVFVDRATTAGMIVHQVTEAELPGAVAACLVEQGAKRVAVGTGSRDAQPLRQALSQAGITVVPWRDHAGMDVQFDLDAGITDVHAAIAETGSLICCSGAGHSRGLSLIPTCHVAIVRRADLVPDHIDWWRDARSRFGADLPSSMAVISGPSKTADIEGELVTGVHGPAEVHIMLIAD